MSTSQITRTIIKVLGGSLLVLWKLRRPKQLKWPWMKKVTVSIPALSNLQAPQMPWTWLWLWPTQNSWTMWGCIFIVIRCEPKTYTHENNHQDWQLVFLPFRHLINLLEKSLCTPIICQWTALSSFRLNSMPKLSAQWGYNLFVSVNEMLQILQVYA